MVNLYHANSPETERDQRELAELRVKFAAAWIPPTRIVAGEKHTLQCQWCLLPFDATVKLSGKFRNSVEYEPLRKILLIADPSYEPYICDGCYDGVLSGSAMSPGDEKSSKVPNFLLRQQELEHAVEP